MDIVTEAFKGLYPDRELNREVSIKYSRKFKPFNSNVKYSHSYICFHLSKDWKTVSREIQIGLIQSLLAKIFKGMPNTGYRDMYESFIKNLSKYSPVTKSDPILEQSFNRVNIKYFNGMMECPNLIWGTPSTRKLGSYYYHTNTITISTLFKTTSIELLDYIMYHELLHKKLKFYSKSGRSYHHTNEFKKAESLFENRNSLEKQLRLLAVKSRIKGIFFPKWLR
jgi:predicted SprT family Zn-dependent metalloprotease